MSVGLLSRYAAVIAAVVVLATGPGRAQTVDDVYPLKPDDGDTTGTRPDLHVAVEGTDVLKMRFRIVMSVDDFETEAYVFDQREDKSGWAFNVMGDADGAVYRTRKPIADGDYDWKVSAWNGVDWVDGDTVFRLRVDGTRPADVERVELSRTEEGGLRLTWAPVTTDVEGQPEYVERYHVYRWVRKHWVFMRAFEVGATERLVFEDNSDVARAAPILFYKVTAEDSAGNHEMKRW